MVSGERGRADTIVQLMSVGCRKMSEDDFERLFGSPGEPHRGGCDMTAADQALTPSSDDDVRVALRRHWTASDAGDFTAEHAIYAEGAILDYPQSGERIRGARNIQASRMAQPNRKRFNVRRVFGGGGLWVSELILTYDEKPAYVVSVMEFEGGKVVRETQYFTEAFEPGPSRAQWVERMD
jgi:SnoaL-like domain